MEFQGLKSGGVSALAIGEGGESLTLLNQQPSLGTGPCYVSTDTLGQYLLVANYMGGSVAALPIAADGRLAPASGFDQHMGNGPDARRQEGPHGHSVIQDPTGTYVYCADLGIDRLYVYRLNRWNGTLQPNSVPWVSTHPGVGPRHLVFHPNGKLAFLANEMASSLTSFSFDVTTGILAAVETVSGLPDDFEGKNTFADVHVSTCGRYVYASNRGHDSIVSYSVNPATGRLKRMGWVSTQGQNPRNFAIDPSGKYLYAANQDSANIVAYRIDQETGALAPTGQTIEVPFPVCIKFVTL